MPTLVVVQTERKGVGGRAAVVVVFAPGVEFTEDEFPVVPLFLAVVAERNAALDKSPVGAMLNAYAGAMTRNNTLNPSKK